MMKKVERGRRDLSSMNREGNNAGLMGEIGLINRYGCWR